MSQFIKHPRVTLLALAGVGVIGSALGISGHFVRGPNAALDIPDAVISWKEAGLGSNQRVDYIARADGFALYQCVNHGGMCPAAANKKTEFGPVTANGSFFSGKNGNIQASLRISPPDSTLGCPGGQVRVLVSASYTNMSLESSASGGPVPTTPSSLGFSGPECP